MAYNAPPRHPARAKNGWRAGAWSIPTARESGHGLLHLLVTFLGGVSNVEYHEAVLARACSRSAPQVRCWYRWRFQRRPHRWTWKRTWSEVRRSPVHTARRTTEAEHGTRHFEMEMHIARLHNKVVTVRVQGDTAPGHRLITARLEQRQPVLDGPVACRRAHRPASAWAWPVMLCAAWRPCRNARLAGLDHKTGPSHTRRDDSRGIR